MACWKCKEKFDPNMDMNFVFCEDAHALCLPCHASGCLKCFCSKDIRFDRNLFLDSNTLLRSQLKEQLVSKIKLASGGSSHLNLTTNGEITETMLLNSLMINNMKQPLKADSKNNITRQSRESLSSDKSLMNFDDADQVS